MANVIYWMWPRQTSGIVSSVAGAEISRIRRITPLQEPLTAMFSLMVSCPITFVGRITKSCLANFAHPQLCFWRQAANKLNLDGANHR